MQYVEAAGKQTSTQKTWNLTPPFRVVSEKNITLTTFVVSRAGWYYPCSRVWYLRFCVFQIEPSNDMKRLIRAAIIGSDS